MPGIEFSETMAGTFALSDRPGEERPFSFTVRAACGALSSGRAELDGTVEAEGFADGVPTTGSLVLDPRARTLRYELDFHGNDGAAYRFAGEKSVKLTRLLRSMTALPGRITDEHGAEVARCATRFELRSQLLPFLGSFRPR